MKVSEKIDWLSITFPHKTLPRDIIPSYIELYTEIIKSPIPVYQHAIHEKNTGIKILFGDERLGQHMILSGKVLDNLRHKEVSMVEMWNIITRNNGKVSRIDLALDVQDNKLFTPRHVQKMYMGGHCDTQMLGNKHIGEDDKTQTFYIGKLNSKNRRFRVYDKGIESELADKVWTRIEYEKRRNAHKTASAHFEHNQSIASLIKTAVDFPSWQLWQFIFDAPKGKIPRSETKDSGWVDKLNWLTNSVSKAITNAMILEYHDKLKDFDVISSEVLNTFSASLSAQIRAAQLRGDLPFSTHENEAEKGSK